MKEAIAETTHWTPLLIKRLRGKRTQQEFGELIGVALNTVWRWEEGRVEPAPEHHRRLSEIAGGTEHFLKDWKLSGSGTLAGDLDSALTRLRSEREQILKKRKQELRS